MISCLQFLLLQCAPHKPAGSRVAAGLLLRTCPSPLAWREGDAEMVDRTRAAPDNSLHQPSPATQLSWKSPLLIFTAPGQRWYLGYPLIHPPPAGSPQPCNDPPTGVTITEMTTNILCNFCLKYYTFELAATQFHLSLLYLCAAWFIQFKISSGRRVARPAAVAAGLV